MEKRLRLKFDGLVQGVGFRFTAVHAANICRLTGYVKNEYDGSVTCEVQGDEDNIEKFIAMIDSSRFIDIERIDRTPLELDCEEVAFEVRF